MSAFELPEGFTPQPWRIEPHDEADQRGWWMRGMSDGRPQYVVMAAQLDGRDTAEEDANAALVALAPAMAAEIRRLEAEVAALQTVREAAWRLLREAEMDDMEQRAGWDCWMPHLRAALKATAPAEPLEGETPDLIGEQMSRTDCHGCKFADWKKTAAGKLHPRGDGKCRYVWVAPQLPGSMYWATWKYGYGPNAGPRPEGGHINRREALPNPCGLFQPVPK